MSKEAMKLALEALTHGGCPPDCKDGMTDSGGVHPWGEAALIPCPNCQAITAIREALAEQPAQRKPLTDEEIVQIELGLRQYNNRDTYDLSLKDFARAIEAAHGIKGDA